MLLADYGDEIYRGGSKYVIKLMLFDFRQVFIKTPCRYNHIS